MELMEEEREEVIRVLPFETGITISRKSHFLKPITNLIETLHSNNLPSHSVVLESPKDSPFMIIMKGGCPQKNWKNWVQKLLPLHQHTWEKAGIFEAILASTYEIKKQRELVIALAERWNFETNTFVFPWGEATVTLEDLMVLGGYSVLGKPVFTPLEKEDMETYYRIRASCKRKSGSYYKWMEYFMGKGGELEHVAFLILWSSRYVFPVRQNIVVRNVFSIAVYLSKGVRIALGPAVLASIYNDLSLLKRLMVAFSKNNGCGFEKDEVKVVLSSPLQFVQLWAWERFPNLRPNPCSIKHGEPRLARWDKLGKSKVENVGEVIDCSGESFQWKPYVVSLENWEFDKWYKANEVYVLVDSEMEMDVEEFVRLVRVSELVGLDCIEHYAPHRVGMQFGFDQDIPGCVNRQNETQEMAWSYYNRLIASSFVYIPPKLFEAGVSTRYFERWNQARLRAEDAPKKSRKLSEVYHMKEEPNHEIGVQNSFSSYDITATGDKVTIDLISSDEEDGLSLSKFLSFRKKQKVYHRKAFGKTLVQCGTRSGTQKLSGNVDHVEGDNSNRRDVEGDELKCDSKKLGSLVEDHAGCEIVQAEILDERGTSTEEVNGEVEPKTLEAENLHKPPSRSKDAERGVISYDGSELTTKEIESRLRNLEKHVRDLKFKISSGNLTGSSSKISQQKE